MSQYVQFFLKINDTSYISLGDFSRSSKMYEVSSNYAPYESSTVLTPSIISDIKLTIKEKTDELKTNIKCNEDLINKISAMPNLIEEKLDFITTYNEIIHDDNISIDQLNYADNFINIISDISIDNGMDIYFGIECGNPGEVDNEPDEEDN